MPGSVVREQPLTYIEGTKNIESRRPLEMPDSARPALAARYAAPAAPVLMKTSVYPQLVALTGIPLRQTINESDKEYYFEALAAPAAHAAIVLAFDGDDIDRAVMLIPRWPHECSPVSTRPASHPARFTSPILRPPPRAQSGDSIGEDESHEHRLAQFSRYPSTSAGCSRSSWSMARSPRLLAASPAGRPHRS